MDEIANTLRAVINTLNGVSVNGRENMNRLLGSIVALEKALASLEAKPEAQDDNH